MLYQLQIADTPHAAGFNYIFFPPWVHSPRESEKAKHLLNGNCQHRHVCKEPCRISSRIYTQRPWPFFKKDERGFGDSRRICGVLPSSGMHQKGDAFGRNQDGLAEPPNRRIYWCPSMVMKMWPPTHDYWRAPSPLFSNILSIELGEANLCVVKRGSLSI